MKKKIKGISLFSSAGIGEMYFDTIGVEIVAANELLKKRAECYSFLHPQTHMIAGDITDPSIKKQIKSHIKKDVRFLIATPPCQGLSTLGKNKNQKQFELDQRNFLIFDTLEIIDYGNFDYVLIENVPNFLKMYFPYKKKLCTLEEILVDKYASKYEIKTDVLDAQDYGVPQSRKRGVTRMFKKGLEWNLPKKEKPITLKESIGHLPSLEAGEKSDIPWHYAKDENPRYVMALRHTPTGQSALKNKKYYPKKENGDRIKGFHNTFKRMVWDQPAHARTTFCGSINSHNNVHPGKLLPDGTYSDARALTPLETFIVSSMPNPKKVKFPSWANLTFINTVIGEGVPPLLLKKVVQQIT